MKPIRVALAQSREDVLSQVIHDALTKSPHFEVEGGIIALGTVHSVLGSGRSIDILIVVGEGSPVVPEALLERHPGMVVSHIVIGSKAVRFDVHDVDVDGLLSTLTMLARNRGNGAPRTVDMQLGDDDSGLVLVPAHSEAMTLAVRWINALLLHHNDRFPLGQGDVAGFARNSESIRRTLNAPDTSPESPALRAASDALMTVLERSGSDDEPLVRLYRRLRLSALELKFLLLCLAADLDAKFHSVIGTFNDDLGQHSPTFALATTMLGDPRDVRASLSRSGAVARLHLLSSGGELPRGDDPVRADAALAGWLLGDADALLNDPAVLPATRLQKWRGASLLNDTFDRDLAETLAQALAPDGRGGRWLVLGGADSDGWRGVLELATHWGRPPLLRISLAALATAPPDALAGAAARLARAASLLGACPIVDAQHLDGAGDPNGAVLALVQAMAPLPQTAALISADARRFVGLLEDAVVAVFERDAPLPATVAARFAEAVAASGLGLGAADCARLGHAFALPLGSIEDAVRLAVMQGAAELEPSDQYAMVAAACRHIASPELPRFAKRIVPSFSLDDIVLPTEWHSQLREIVHNVTHDATVMNRWGFAASLPLGRGIACLFHGPSGTGKTTAAQAIAKELDTEVCQLDLSLLESKYIGETAKNVDAVFTDAERSRAVLCCDEADAILGKRSEIKDAHDRYANIDVAYLLQRIEAYSGLVILTTNFRQNIDQAFLRRFRFVIEFPKPDAAAREAIWRKCLPSAAPVAADLDFGFLARRVELTGGNIRQITLRAAFAAAAENAGEIGMRHILSATRAELVKADMVTAVRELDEFEIVRGRSLRQVA